jgi:REP element-mobilizing transposase RayT
MSHSFTNLLVHIVFGTKERHPWLDSEARAPLFAYFGGVIRAEGGILLIANGIPDHVHILAKLRQDKTVADVVRAIKAASSHWLRKKLPGGAGFAWQTGYGAFGVSQSQVEVVHEYIRNQEEHHRRMPFSEEFLRLLAAHGVTVTEKDLWG